MRRLSPAVTVSSWLAFAFRQSVGDSAVEILRDMIRMTRREVQQQTECIAKLAERLSRQNRLTAEVQRARRQFFGEDLAQAGDDTAEHRFAEWFLLERESESLGAVPVTVPPYVHDAGVLDGSTVGLFLVSSVGTTVTVTDLQEDEILELSEEGSLQVGDLLVGRLYPVTGERWAPSAATPALRPGKDLAKAFMHDLKKLELDRRLHQIELEHLLLRQHGQSAVAMQGDSQREPDPAEMLVEPSAPLEHLEADLEKILLPAGDHYSAAVISDGLAQSSRPGEVIGPLLDQLAFDTDIDLDEIRRLLLEIWNAHHAGDSGHADDSESSGPPGETLGEQLVRKLDQGKGEKQDVEELFAQIEKIAGIEADDDEDDDGRNTAIVDQVFEVGDSDGDAGDLGPLISEFHWESGQEDPEQSGLALWVELQRNAPIPNTNLESIAAPDLMRLLLHIYLRSAPAERAAQVRAAFEELRLFYDWVVVTQELDKRDVLAHCKGTLLDQLDRLQDAGVALSNDQAPMHSPGLLQVEETGADGIGARDDDGEHHWLMADAATVAHVEIGDLLLGGFATTQGDEPTSMHRRLAGLVVVLPIDARSLIE
jgi:hypothetical protein